MGALVMKAEGLPAHELGEIEVRAQGSFKQMHTANLVTHAGSLGRLLCPRAAAK